MPTVQTLFNNRYKVDDMPDLTGKVAIVTGGSRGIGEGIAEALVQKNCTIHLISATPEHGSEAISHLTSLNPSAPSLVTHHPVDLGSLSSVLSLSRSLASSLPRLDILFLNAGIGVAPFGLTSDGLGNHFAINHLAGVLMTDVLLPKLRDTAAKKHQGGGGEEETFSTRIVAQSSELHRTAPNEIKCESVEEMNTDIGANTLYSRSKLFNILFIRQLAQVHLPSLTSPSPILALSVHPGGVGTEQIRGASEAYGLPGKVFEAAASVLFKTKEEGAEAALWAGTGQSVVGRREEVQGRYFTEPDGKVDTETDQAKSDDLARKLWDLSVRVIKDKTGYEVQM